MRHLLVVIALLLSFNTYSQSCPCTGFTLSGGSFDTNTAGYNLNGANDFCIPSGTTYTGPLPATQGGSLTICGTWDPTSPVSLDINGAFTLTNNGTIDMGTNSFIFKSSDDQFINNGTFTSMGFFELADATMVNNGAFVAADIYLHGTATNTATGTMESTSDCGGTPTQSCGFYVGDKSSGFQNDGSLLAVDFLSRVPVIGNGGVEASNSISLRGDYGSSTTNNTFTAPTITLFESNNTLSGTFFATTFNCDTNTFVASVCNLDGSEVQDINDGNLNGTDCGSGSLNNTSCLTVLPIDLLAFDVVNKDNSLTFIWETASEENFSHFELQVRSDYSDYKTIGIFEGKGSNSIYQSHKINASSEVSYFRLKMVDIDGSYDYSDVIPFDGAEIKEIEFFPNPISIEETLQIHNPAGSKLVVSIFALDGTRRGTFVAKGEYPTISIADIENISSGIYIMELYSEGISQTKQLVVK